MKNGKTVLVDTGPLVALFDANDAKHLPCVQALKKIEGPLFTLWPAITEAMYLLSFSLEAQAALLGWIASGSLKLLELQAEDTPRIQDLMKKYRDLPMDFTDAALVCIAERETIRTIFTVDTRDFRIYKPRHTAHFLLLP